MEMQWKRPQGVAPTETTRVQRNPVAHLVPWKQPQGVAPTETT
jgi:hypothetical protein